MFIITILSFHVKFPNFMDDIKDDVDSNVSLKK